MYYQVPCDIFRDMFVQSHCEISLHTGGALGVILGRSNPEVKKKKPRNRQSLDSKHAKASNVPSDEATWG